jgi:hypothetical protein
MCIRTDSQSCLKMWMQKSRPLSDVGHDDVINIELRSCTED